MTRVTGGTAEDRARRRQEQPGSVDLPKTSQAVRKLLATVVGLSLLCAPCVGCSNREADTRVHPTVVYVTPADGWEDVSRYTRIGIRFDRPMDPQSVGGRFRIDPVVSFSYQGEENVVYIQPLEPLAPDTTYRLALAAGAVDLEGVESADVKSWSFKTAPPSYVHLPTFTALPPVPVMAGVRAMAFAPSGELYVVSPSDVGVISIGPGNGATYEPLYGGFQEITDVAVDDSGELWLIIAETGSYRVARLDESGKETLVLPIGQPSYPEGQENWFYPKDLAVLTDGDLLILGTDRIRRLDQSGRVKSDIGIGLLGGAVTEGYFGPSGLVVDGHWVYATNGCMSLPSAGPVCFDLDGRLIGSYQIGRGRYWGLALDGWGNFYLQDETCRMLLLGPKGDPLDALVDVPSPGTYMANLLVLDDVLYAACPHEGQVLRWGLADLPEPEVADDSFAGNVDRLIAGAFKVTIGMFRVGCLRYDSGRPPVEKAGRSYFPVTDERFKVYWAFEQYIRSVYTNELADGFIADPKYVKYNCRTYTTGGEGGTGWWFARYTIRVIKEEQDYAEIELTIPSLWEDSPPNISIMKFVFQQGRWLISRQEFGT